MRVLEDAGVVATPCGLRGAAGRNHLVITRRSGPRWVARVAGRDLEERRYVVCAECSARTPVISHPEKPEPAS